MTADGLVLGIETATSRPGLALLSDREILGAAGFHRRVSPSRWLMPGVQLLLAAAGRELSQLSALAVTVGPGGFTGIRVGLATARALAEASGRPLAGVSTLAAAAAAADPAPGETMAVWLDAGRQEVYAGLFRDGRPVADEQVAAPSRVLAGLPPEPLRFVGDGACRYADLIAARPGTGDTVVPLPAGLAAAAARLGRAALAAGDPLPPAPRYLRPPDATRARG